MNILIFGDSITWGAWDDEGGWANRLRKVCTTKTIASEFQREYYVYNLGICGDTSVDVLKRLEEEAQLRIDTDYDTLLIMAVGINDSQVSLGDNMNKIPLDEFTQTIQKLMKKGKALGTELIFVGLSPVNEEQVSPMPWKTTHGYQNKHIKIYNDVIETMCKEDKVCFLDVFTTFQKNEYKNLLSDGLHPNTRGHTFIFQLLEDHLKESEIL